MGQRDLMGTAEIALRLRVTRSRVSQLARERDFPEPAARLIMGQVWEAADIEAWILRRRPNLDEDAGPPGPGTPAQSSG